MSEDNDVWIEVVGPGNSLHAKYYGMYAYTVPYGTSGNSEVRVKFNLSAFVRDEIAKVLDSKTKSPPDRASS